MAHEAGFFGGFSQLNSPLLQVGETSDETEGPVLQRYSQENQLVLLPLSPSCRHLEDPRRNSPSFAFIKAKFVVPIDDTDDDARPVITNKRINAELPPMPSIAQN